MAFTKSWVYGDYAKHLKDVMFEREQSLLPLAVAEIERHRLEYEREEKTRKLHWICSQIDHAQRSIKNKEVMIQRYEDTIKRNMMILNDFETGKIIERNFSNKALILRDNIYYSNEILNYQRSNDLTRKELQKYEEEQAELIEDNISLADYSSKKITYHRPCPQDGCKGFINSHWKCGLCETEVCKDCREIFPVFSNSEQRKKYKEEHKCNDDAVETAKLLDKDTKPCPNCKIPIFKIEGCDQMYCIQCKTAFSWNTGKIETGRIHNPHYYEMLRKMSPNGEIPRETADMGQQCNENNVNVDNMYYAFRKPFKIEWKDLTSLRKYLRNFNSLSYYAKPICDFYSEVARIKTHLQTDSLANFRPKNLTEDNMGLRMQYVQNQINKKDWQIQLLKKWKRNEYNIEIYQLIEAVLLVLNQILREVIMSAEDCYNKKEVDVEKLNEYTRKVLELLIYFNEHSEKIMNRYDYSVTPYWLHSIRDDVEKSIRFTIIVSKSKNSYGYTDLTVDDINRVMLGPLADCNFTLFNHRVTKSYVKSHEDCKAQHRLVMKDINQLLYYIDYNKQADLVVRFWMFTFHSVFSVSLFDSTRRGIINN